MARQEILCLTPVRNEAHRLARFLDAAATWADRIIVLDQLSDDGSDEIAESHPKVELIRNRSPEYDESARQELLLKAARRHGSGNVLVALDADEALTTQPGTEEDWRAVRDAPAGTPLLLHWVNLLPDGQAWVPGKRIRFGLVDDGAEHRGSRIHSTRVPAGTASPLELSHLGVLHLQYLDEGRMRGKQRWYQAWEVVDNPAKHAAQLYRQYHQMNARPQSEIAAVDPAWFTAYDDAGVDLTVVVPSPWTMHDGALLDLVLEYGEERFRRLDVWDGWLDRAQTRAARPLVDPRTPFDRRVLRFLAATQPRADRHWVRALQVALRVSGW